MKPLIFITVDKVTRKSKILQILETKLSGSQQITIHKLIHALKTVFCKQIPNSVPKLIKI